MEYRFNYQWKSQQKYTCPFYNPKTRFYLLTNGLRFLHSILPDGDFAFLITSPEIVFLLNRHPNKSVSIHIHKHTPYSSLAFYSASDPTHFNHFFKVSFYYIVYDNKTSDILSFVTFCKFGIMCEFLLGLVHKKGIGIITIILSIRRYYKISRLLIKGSILIIKLLLLETNICFPQSYWQINLNPPKYLIMIKQYRNKIKITLFPLIPNS